MSKALDLAKLITSDILTSGDLADGVKDLGNEFEVNSFVLHKSQNTIKTIKNIYNK